MTATGGCCVLAAAGPRRPPPRGYEGRGAVYLTYARSNAGTRCRGSGETRAACGDSGYRDLLKFQKAAATRHLATPPPSPAPTRAREPRAPPAPFAAFSGARATAPAGPRGTSWLGRGHHVCAPPPPTAPHPPGVVGAGKVHEGRVCTADPEGPPPRARTGVARQDSPPPPHTAQTHFQLSPRSIYSHMESYGPGGAACGLEAGSRSASRPTV